MGAETSADHGDGALTRRLDVRERTALRFRTEHCLHAQARVLEHILGSVTELVVAERRVEGAISRELQQLDRRHRSASGGELEGLGSVDDLTWAREVVDASERHPLDVPDDGGPHSTYTQKSFP
jgi:hypothetical protein